MWGWVEHEGNRSQQPIRSSEQLVFVPEECLSRPPTPGLTAQQQPPLSTYHVLSPVLNTILYIKSFNPHWRVSAVRSTSTFCYSTF